MELSRWKEALEHARLLSRMIVLEGNVSDVFMQESGLQAGRLVELDEYLFQYLKDAGYHSVVYYNRIDSFYNHCDETGEMLKLFYRVAGNSEEDSKMDVGQAMVSIRTAMKNESHSVAIIINMAGQLISTPNHLNEHELEYLTTLYLAAKESSEAPVSSPKGWTTNLLILITNKVHELPAWFYRYAPFARSIEIEMPGEKLRRSLFLAHSMYYMDWKTLCEEEREKWLLRSGTRPRGVMLFAGPTGVGKTELAKSMAREIFGTEEAMIRFDMSEYSQSHSDQRLLGAPPGYVGYDAGGELTNAVKSKPFSILLFDEIEKANPTILDKFLQILDDGRMTDSKGETVYFTECFLVFTSNIGMNSGDVSDGKECLAYADLEKMVVKALRETWRPEFVNRIGQNVIVFDYIREKQAEAILKKQLCKVCAAVYEQNHISIVWKDESDFYQKIRAHCIENLQYGGRGIGNAVEHYFITPLGREIAFGNVNAGEKMEVTDIKTNGITTVLVWK